MEIPEIGHESWWHDSFCYSSCVLHNICLDMIGLEDYEDFIIEGHDDDDNDDDNNSDHHFIRQSVNFQDNPEGILKRQYLTTIIRWLLFINNVINKERVSIFINKDILI